MPLVPLEELFVFALLLLGVVGVYGLLKLHYIFAFGLMKNTASYEKHKEKILQIKLYVFFVLKVLLVLGLLAMTYWGISMMVQGHSLKVFVLESWQKIPDGFWVTSFLVLVRIAVLIVLSRFVLKKISLFLTQQQQKTLTKNVYNALYVESLFSLIHFTIKYTVVLGIMYRVTHFFPFLEKVSETIGGMLVVFIVLTLSFLLHKMIKMFKSKQS